MLNLAWLTFYTVDRGTAKGVEGFLQESISVQLTLCGGSKISNAPESNSFATSFMHLRLRREVRRITGGEERQGRDRITGQLTRVSALSPER